MSLSGGFQAIQPQKVFLGLFSLNTSLLLPLPPQNQLLTNYEQLRDSIHFESRFV
jgi:hypothetical protein